MAAIIVKTKTPITNIEKQTFPIMAMACWPKFSGLKLPVLENADLPNIYNLTRSPPSHESPTQTQKQKNTHQIKKKKKKIPTQVKKVMKTNKTEGRK